MAQSAILERMTVPARAARQLDDLVAGPSKPLVSSEDDEAASADGIALFNLSEAIAFALQNSPRLRSAREAVRHSQGQEQAAFAPFLPQVDMFARYGWTSSNLSPGAPGPVGGLVPSSLTQDHNFVQAEMDAQWTLCDFGRRAGRYGQAVARERIAELQLYRAQQTVAYDVAASYLALLRTQAARQVQEQTVRRAEKFLDDSTARRQGGVAEREDVLRAEVQLAEARDALILSHQAEYDALARLNFALGRNVSLPLQIVDWQSRPAFARTLPQCLETAVANRREITVALEAVAGAQHGVTAARAEFYPHLYIRGSIGRADGSGIETGWHEGAAIHLDQSLYTGGRRSGERLAAEAEVRSVAAGAQTLFDTITLEVNLAFRGVAAARDRISLAEKAIAQARENLRLVEVKYRNGNATPTDVVDAETALTRAEQRYFTAIYDYLGSLSRLEYAMGAEQGCLTEQKPGEADDG